MLVSHIHRFIFSKTSKTAGTSVESYFERFCLADPNEPIVEHREEYVSEFGIVGARSPTAGPHTATWWNHMPLGQIKRQLDPDIFDNYFKFSCVRNPFDRAVSFYFWLTASRMITLPDTLPHPLRFEKWLERRGFGTDRSKYCIKGKFVMDDIIRYESLLSDMERICGKLGLPWEPEWLPKFKARSRPAGSSVAEMYTPKSRALVEAECKFELDLFGYRFPVEAEAA